MPGKGKLTLTGQLGDVMRESAQAALSYVRGHARARAGARRRLVRRARHPRPRARRRDPQGRPERGHHDGDRARRRCSPGGRVRDDVAMTGEITLTGQVLPIGGLKEKALAAQRGGHQHGRSRRRATRPTSTTSPSTCARRSSSTSSRDVDEVLDVALEQTARARKPRGMTRV